jgi:N-acetylglucosamine-6-sulfatase
MTRSAGKAVLALAAALLVAAGIASTTATAHRVIEQKRPNIVVIMTDDENVENMRFMANVHRLIAANGVTFDNSFVSLSQCCPSRSTFLTGQYAHNHGVLNNSEPNGGYYALDNSNTLAVWLQKAGYFTTLIGKYLNQYGTRNPIEIPPGWSDWHGLRDPYHYYDYRISENGVLRAYVNTYQTDQLTQEAVSAIRAHAASTRPFFLWLTYVAPHSSTPEDSGAGDKGAHTAPPSPPVPAPRTRGAFANVPLPRPPSFNETDVSDKPAAVRRLPLLTPGAIAATTAYYHDRAESLLSVDQGVQEILDALSNVGALDNTFVVFTSDNGWMQGEHRITEGKRVPYEPSIRVPLIVRGPGVPAGVHLPQIVANIDLAPTIVDLADAVPGRTMDGLSFLPLLKNRNLWFGRDLLIESPTKSLAAMPFRGIRTPRYVYVEYYYQPPESELYDLAKDPFELQNVAKDPAYAKVRAELAARLARLRACRGPSCRVQPALELSVRCAGTLTSAAVTGADEARLVRVDFSVGGRRVSVDGQAPFRVLTRSKGWVRMLAMLDDGTRMTLVRAGPRC